MTTKTNSLDISFEEAARQSVFLGLVRLHQLRTKYPSASDEDLIRANAAGPLVHAGSNVAVATLLIDALALHGLEHNAVSMRRFLRTLLVSDQPSWIIAALRGRHALQAVMPQSTAQCFAFARLFDPTPDQETVVWWDELVESQRASDGQILKDRGRDGERLTVRYEIERLSRIGIADEPKWVALDDEWLGYDVLSFDYNSTGQIFNRLIEVKACSAWPLRIYLTRNEWDRATQAQDAYKFHIWHLPSETLTELTFQDLRQHIPCDNGSGKWRETLIDLR
jgi:hypothetical protein